MSDVVPGHHSAASQPLDFDAFVRAHGARLVASFAWVRRYHLDPRDIAQEALTIVYARYEERQFVSDEMLYNYTRVVGTNVARGVVGPDGHAVNEVHSDDPGSAESGPHSADAAELAVEKADMQRAFAALSQSHRQVLLYNAAGHSASEVATRLGLRSPDAARMLLMRARRALDDALAPSVLCVVPATAWSWRRWSDEGPAAALAHAAPAAAPAMTAAAAVVALALVASLTPGAAGRAAASPPGPAGPAATGHLSPGGTAGPAGPEDGPAPQRPGGARPAGHPPREARQPGAGALAVPVPPGRVTVKGPGTRACVPTTRPCDAAPGDTVTVVVGPGPGPSVSQTVVPVCDHVPTTPAVRCTRQETDRWTVKDVPPHPTGGDTS